MRSNCTLRGVHVQSDIKMGQNEPLGGQCIMPKAPKENWGEGKKDRKKCCCNFVEVQAV